ncbi:MAG: prepilin-type N-terminal cleavage/methylation domain-containing protein [Planctomycetes bacterium]|nr:prepilin-type N-terminal cleavage/methylation domain-containing protein [Planctomycetota bacterium]
MTHRQRGFTLLELLVSIAISALVLTTAFAALGMLAEADARTSRRSDTDLEIDGALRLLGRDVGYAEHLAVESDRLVAVAADGTAVVWAVTPRRDELHRIEGASATDATNKADALRLDTVASPRFSARGHLLDADYRTSALLQGVTAVDWVRIERRSQTVGVRVTIQHDAEAGPDTARAVAMQLPKLATGY